MLSRSRSDAGRGGGRLGRAGAGASPRRVRSSTPRVEPLEGRVLLTQVVHGINHDLYAVDAKGSLWIDFDGNGPQGPSGWVHEGGSYIDSIAADRFGAGGNSVRIIARTTDGSMFEFDAAAGQSTGTWTNLNKQLASFAVSGYSFTVYGLDSGGTLWYLPVGSPPQTWQSAGAPPVAGNRALASFVLSARRAYVPHDEIYARTLDGEIARLYFSLTENAPIWQDLNGNLTNLVTVYGGVAGLDGGGSLWVFDYQIRRNTPAFRHGDIRRLHIRRRNT